MQVHYYLRGGWDPLQKGKGTQQWEPVRTKTLKVEGLKVLLVRV